MKQTIKISMATLDQKSNRVIKDSKVDSALACVAAHSRAGTVLRVEFQLIGTSSLDLSNWTHD